MVNELSVLCNCGWVSGGTRFVEIQVCDNCKSVCVRW